MKTLLRAIGPLFFVALCGLLVSTSASADHLRQVQCTASRAPNTLIDEEECRWLWYRAAYLELSSEYAKSWDAWLENRARAQEQVNQFFGGAAALIDIGENFLGEAKFGAMLADTTLDLTTLWLSSLPVDEDTATAIAKDWAIRSTNAMYSISKSKVLKTDPALPYDDFLRLANDFGFLVNEMRLTRGRYTEIVINDYLFNYYVAGRGHKDVTEAFGLKPNSASRSVFDAIYDKNNTDTTSSRHL